VRAAGEGWPGDEGRATVNHARAAPCSQHTEASRSSKTAMLQINAAALLSETPSQ